MIELFCGYARNDEITLEKLFEHLSPLERAGLIHVWYDREIRPGEPFADEIKTHLEKAQIILLSISASFIKSDHCYEEMLRALSLQEQGRTYVLPVILRYCDWKATPLGRLQALPTDGRPITDRTHWPDEDNAWFNVIDGVKKVMAQILENEGDEYYQAGLYLEYLVASKKALSLTEQKEDANSPPQPSRDSKGVFALVGYRRTLQHLGGRWETVPELSSW